jgi:hypothetical protein
VFHVTRGTFTRIVTLVKDNPVLQCAAGEKY